jgi:hypothetical protein
MMEVSFRRETQVVKEGTLELGFTLRANGAGALCGSVTVGMALDQQNCGKHNSQSHVESTGQHTVTTSDGNTSCTPSG